MNSFQKYKNSHLALIFSALAAVATFLAALVKGLVAAGQFTLSNPENADLALQISAVMIVLGLATYAFLEPDRVRKFLGGRQARYGSNLLILIVAFLGIVFVVNYLVYTDPTPAKADFTEDKQNSLSPEMVRALESLPEQMTATGFFSSQSPTDSARQLLENMKSNGGGKFDYSFVDPEANPLAAKTAGVTGDGKIVLEMAGQKEIADYADEREILLAIVRILNPENRTVYFLVGHGEADIQGNGERSMTRAQETLVSKNYTVKTLNLLATGRIPDDAKAIIVAGPTQPVSPNEVSLLVNYALHGGALIVMEDPIPLTDFGDATDPLAEALKREWGLHLRNDFVVDTFNQTRQNAVGATFDSLHPITRTTNLLTIFPYARSIEILEREGITQTPLVLTNLDSESWGETDFTSLSDSNAIPDYTDGVDTFGPLVLAAAVENANAFGRVVMIGNSTFATDQGFDAYGNGDLFVNSVDWAVGQEDTIGLTPKETIERRYTAPSNTLWMIIMLGTICLVPGAVIGFGVYAWVSRRRRG